MFAHVDVNSFYASCEKVFRPDLKNLPVIVLSNNDGCVIARSQEAKKLGIKMGHPYFQLSDKFIKQNNVHVFSSNYALYADMSNRVMDTIESLVPYLEIYSIDEAFCDISGLDHISSFYTLGQTIRKTVNQYTHLTVGVGIAQTKTLAKLANYAAKTWAKTGGVVDLSDKERQKKLMSITPVNEVWGIGRKLSKRLNELNIQTALDLSNLSPYEARQKFNIVLERTIRELNGESCLMLEDVAPPRKQIICSRSFGQKVTEYNIMREAICNYTARAAEKLREDNQYCKNITVFIKTSPFAQQQYYSNYSSEKIIATNDTRQLLQTSEKILKRIWADNKHYQKAGVILNDFCDIEINQYHLFSDYHSKERNEKLMKVIDTINKSRYSPLFFASQGTQGNWHMKQDQLSPSYTTRINDIANVKI
ncbi:translesion error-prone DNA polymerase V subunit UmuC [Orbus wheelerorum]|uniref:translesion error-prone DNA polymerase V subunit UmuC n=1 Tax=Orbus wheelerorum TaxID=3074111 RepID=UPI00370D9B6D